MSATEQGLAILGHPDIRGAVSPWNRAFRNPVDIFSDYDPRQVGPFLERIQHAVSNGKHVVFMLAYEAAPGLDTCLQTHDVGEFPLLWAALYDAPLRTFPEFPVQPWSFTPWQARTSPEQYSSAIREIKEFLRQGETYQVNYTMALDSTLSGNVLSMYSDVARRMQGAYSMYLDMGRFKVASFSPELFFYCQGQNITVKPMKGTARRGRWLSEDTRHGAALFSSPKERAENVMIVDLLRNDLGRLAIPGSVHVSRLFEVETYPSVLQMTSTITAKLRDNVNLWQLFTALFPCGSVTGAPKVRTMQIIHHLEHDARWVYCGALGYVSSEGVCMANVPIRTVLVDTRKNAARFWVGGGITADSFVEAEYDECKNKMLFLTEPRPEFNLLESLLLDDGEYFLLERHLMRLGRSAEYFAFTVSKETLLQMLNDIGKEHPLGRYKVRLLVARDGKIRVEVLPIVANQKIVRLGKAQEVVHSDDIFLFHKTTNRSVYEQVKARFSQCDDVLLGNEHGEITETCFANIVYTFGGDLYTPPRTSGLLAGTMRQELLEKGRVSERVLPWEELEECEKLWCVNSVRKWKRAVLVS